MINCITLMGRLTADPILKVTTTGRNVTSFTIAVERSFIKQGEERVTDFINIVAWQQKADFICRYFKKGSMIALTGSLQSRSYEDKTGAKRTAFEVVANEISFCVGKNTQNVAEESDRYPTTGYYKSPDMSDDYFDEVPQDEELPF